MAFRIFVLVFFFLSVPVQVFGQNGETATCLKLFTQYFENDTKEVYQARNWEACIVTRGDGNREINFSLEGSRKKPLCRIKYGTSEGAPLYLWEDLRLGRTMSNDIAFLINPGYPVPSDILPISDGRHIETAHIRQSAGGQVFSHTYKITEEKISSEDASGVGMIRETDFISDTLLLFTVFDKDGEIVLKQLWPYEGASWWIYEETAYRRSWRSNQEN